MSARDEFWVGERVRITAGMHAGVDGVVAHVATTGVITVEHTTPPPGWPYPSPKRVVRLPYGTAELERETNG